MRFLSLIILTTIYSCSIFAQLNLRPSNDSASAKDNLSKFLKKPIVVLVSIDGARHDYPNKFQLKSILEIGKQGVYAKSLIPVFPSKTFPNHYSIVTGLYPAHHGILENNFYDPNRQKIYSPNDPFSVRDSAWYKGTPLWVLAEKQGLRTASYFWVGSEASIENQRPTYYFPYKGETPNEERVSQVLSWVMLPKEKRPGFISLYFSIVDNAGHDFGPDAIETKNAALEVDRLVNILWSGLQKSSVPFVLILVSDHGMSKLESKKMIHLDEYIQTSEFEIQGSGSFVSLYRKQNSNIKKAMLSLKKLEPNVVSYEKNNIPQKYRIKDHPSTGDIVLIAQLPWYVNVSKRKTSTQMGSHGWDPIERDMHGIFYAVGQGLPKGIILEPFENIHLYKWIANIAGLKVPSRIDGDDRVIEALSHRTPSDH